LLQSGLKKPILDADTNIGYAGRLRSAYWDFVKDHGYERTIDIHEIGSPCRLAVFGGSAFVLNGTVVPEATINLGSSTVTSGPYTTEQLATRVIPIRFSNPDAKTVKVTLEATTATTTPLNYKIYEGTVPTTQTDCTNDPEGTFQNGTKAEILETVSNKTELVIFVANTDFATASSFTVKVEESTTKPVVKQLTPTGPQNVIDNPVILIGIQGQTVTNTLTLTNEGSTASIMDYTMYPIGQGVEDGSISSLGVRKKVRAKGIGKTSIRAPIVTGTASNLIYSSSLSSPKSGRIRNVNNLDAVGIDDKFEFVVSAKCPTPVTAATSTIYEGVEYTYTTGLTDDYGTPNDPSDDRPELEVGWIPIQLECAPKFFIEGQPYYGPNYGYGTFYLYTNAVIGGTNSTNIVIGNTGLANLVYDTQISNYSQWNGTGQTPELKVSSGGTGVITGQQRLGSVNLIGTCFDSGGRMSFRIRFNTNDPKRPVAYAFVDLRCDAPAGAIANYGLGKLKFVSRNSTTVTYRLFAIIERTSTYLDVPFDNNGNPNSYNKIDLGERTISIAQEESVGVPAWAQEVFQFWKARAKPQFVTYAINTHDGNGAFNANYRCLGKEWEDSLDFSTDPEIGYGRDLCVVSTISPSPLN
jgi:hypothetical protein